MSAIISKLALEPKPAPKLQAKPQAKNNTFNTSSLKSTCNKPKAKLHIGSQSRQSRQSRYASPYRPITEQDLDLEFLSIISLPKNETPLKRTLYFAAPLLALLATLYGLVISTTIVGLTLHALSHYNFTYEQVALFQYIYYTLLFCAPLFVGFIILVFLLKPLLARLLNPQSTSILLNKDNALFLSFINKIADKIDAPHPTEVHLTLEPKIGISIIGSFLAPRKNRLRLSIGMPLIAQSNSQQLTSLLIKEFAFYNRQSGKNATRIIRHVHRWLYHASKKPDAIDNILDNIQTKSSSKSMQYLVTQAQSVADLTRQFYTPFYRVTDWIAAPALHNLYFRADQINHPFCGINAIRIGEAHHRFLNDGYARWQKSAKVTDTQRQIDLVNTIVEHAKVISKEQTELPLHQLTRKTGMYAPSWKARLARLPDTESEILYQQKYPAQCLMPNFQKLSLKITTLFYSSHCEGSSNCGKLHKDLGLPKPDNSLMTDYFSHLFRHDIVLTPSWKENEYGSSLSLKKDLEITIHQLRQAIPDGKKIIESLDSINQMLAETKIQADKLSPISTEKQVITKTLAHLTQTQNGILVERSTIDNLLNLRLSLGISDHVIHYSNSKLHFSNSMAVLQMLNTMQPKVSALRTHTQSLQQLLSNVDQQQRSRKRKRDPNLQAQLKKSAVVCGKSILSIQKELDKEVQSPRVERLTQQMEKLRSDSCKDPIARLNASRHVLEAFRDLYASIITEIVEACTEAEKKMKIAPLKLTLGRPTH
ncbi:MAG: hypothetical protein KUG82_11240 [Pseudomonadales bacterium]|nr:hypothetical protein [Pseudomonadales bacterium]